MDGEQRERQLFLKEGEKENRTERGQAFPFVCRGSKVGGILKPGGREVLESTSTRKGDLKKKLENIGRQIETLCRTIRKET